MCSQLPNANSLLLLFLWFGFSLSYSVNTTQRECIICFAVGGKKKEATFKKQPSYTLLQLWKMWLRRRKPSPWVVDIREICWMKGIHLIEDLSFCILSRNYPPLYTKLFACFFFSRLEFLSVNKIAAFTVIPLSLRSVTKGLTWLHFFSPRTHRRGLPPATNPSQ